jgi:serine/threonine protein kinase/formylglycine-generating enzyme required for sulfatase activity/WD40 repeat protein
MASVAFRCPHCSASLNLPDKVVGKRIKCPKCQQIITAEPTEPEKPIVPGQPTVNETRDFSNPHDESRLEQGGDDDDSGDSPPSLDFLRPAQKGDELGRLGNFRILRELGRGGMGVVFLAEDLKLGRQVALKVMLPQHAARPKSKDRFLREAKTAASIENDHIITIHQVDEDNGVPFLAMPVLKGEPLNDRLRREKRLPMAEVVRIGWEICDGLQAAHDRKLVHRDLKPSNLWIESPKGRVKILDFGLAKPIETVQHLTRTGAVVGTPAYMSPEQARSPNVDSRSDLFSLGVILYQMLTGRLPFRGHDAISTLMAICNDPAEPPAKLVNDLPAELNELVLKLLAKEPQHRFASAQEVGLALEAICRKHFGGPAVPTPEEPNPFSFRTKPDKLVSLSSSEKTLPASPPEQAPPSPWGRMRPWMLLAAGVLGTIVLVAAIVVIRNRGDNGPAIAAVADPKKPGDAVVEKKEPPVDLLPAEPVAEAEDPFPQFDPTPLPPWDLPKDAPKPALAPFDAKQAKKHQEEWAAYLKTPVVMENSIGMKLALVPPGEFDLVRIADLAELDPKVPKRRIRLTHGYYLGRTSVTYAQFKAFVDHTGYKSIAETSGTGGFGVFADWGKSYPEYDWKKPGPIDLQPDHPVVALTTEDARAFCAWLSKKEKANYRLPTEAERENACRAGSDSPFGVCGQNEDIGNYAWGLQHTESSWWKTEPPFHRVGLKFANAFGFLDIIGNVHELCADDLRRKRSLSEPSANIDPWGPRRKGVIRGSAFNLHPWAMHPGFRAVRPNPQINIGFRVLRQTTPEVEEPPFLKPLLAKRGVPLSADTIVQRPLPIKGLRSWTIEMRRRPYRLEYRSKNDLIVTSAYDALCLWSPTGALDRVFLGHERQMHSFDVSSDGTRIASLDRDSIRLWETATGKCLANFNPIDRELAHLSFSPDGKSLLVREVSAVGCDSHYIVRLSDGSVQELRTESWFQAWSPTGDRIAFAAERRAIVVDLAEPSKIRELKLPGTLPGDPSSMFSAVAWSPDGQTIAACDKEGIVHLWSGKTFEPTGTLKCEHEATGLAWSPSSDRLLVLGGASPSIWNVREGKRIRVRDSGPWPTFAAWTADDHVIVASNENEGGIWWIDATIGEKLRQGPDYPSARRNPHWGVVGEPGMEQLAVSVGSVLRSFDVATGEIKQTKLWGYPGAIAVAPQHRFASIHAGDKDGTLLISDASLASRPREIEGLGKTAVQAFAWSPNGRVIAVAAETKQVLILNVADGVRLKELPEKKRVQSLSWSPDGNSLATLDEDAVVKIWNPFTGSPISSYRIDTDRSWDSPDFYFGVDWSADGRTLWFGLRDQFFAIDLESDKITKKIMKHEVWCPSWLSTSSDRNCHLLGCYRGELFRFGDEAGRRKLVGRRLRSARFLSDNRRFVGGLDDRGMAIGFDFKSGRRLGTLIPQLGDKHWIFIGPDGHYAGSEGVEEHIVYVAMTDDGRQETYTPAEFARRYGWKNDPSKARFAALPP